MKYLAIAIALSGLALSGLSLWNLLRPEPPMREEGYTIRYNTLVGEEIGVYENFENVERANLETTKAPAFVIEFVVDNEGNQYLPNDPLFEEKRAEVENHLEQREE